MVPDACDFITCEVPGETCKAGVCMCGTSESCEANSRAPTCDPFNNRCVCGSIGYSTEECTIPDEVCVEGECKCGNSSTCQGNPDGSICDAVNSQCQMCKPMKMSNLLHLIRNLALANYDLENNFLYVFR